MATIEIEMHNAHAVLPRILLAFSRRRLRISSLSFSDSPGAPVARMVVAVACSDSVADAVAVQVARIFEVRAARLLVVAGAAHGDGSPAPGQPVPEPAQAAA